MTPPILDDRRRDPRSRQFDYDEQAEDWEYASHLHDMAESAHQMMYDAYSSAEESLNYLDELLAELEEE